MAPDAPGPEHILFGGFTHWNHTDAFANDASLGSHSGCMFPWDLNIGLEEHGGSEHGKVVALVVFPYTLSDMDSWPIIPLALETENDSLNSDTDAERKGEGIDVSTLFSTVLLLQENPPECSVSNRALARQTAEAPLDSLSHAKLLQAALAVSCVQANLPKRRRRPCKVSFDARELFLAKRTRHGCSGQNPWTDRSIEQVSMKSDDGTSFCQGGRGMKENINP